MRRRIGGLAVALFAATLAAAVAGCSGAETASGAGADGGAAVRPAAPDFTTDAIQAAGGKLSASRFTLSERVGAVSVLYFSFVG